MRYILHAQQCRHTSSPVMNTVRNCAPWINTGWNFPASRIYVLCFLPYSYLIALVNVLSTALFLKISFPKWKYRLQSLVSPVGIFPIVGFCLFTQVFASQQSSTSPKLRQLVYSSFWWLPYIEKKSNYFHWATVPRVFLVEHDWFC